MHSDERGRVEKPVLRQLEDQLVEVFRRYAKRIHQRRLDGGGYFGDPGLVITAFDNVDFGERHGRGLPFSSAFQCSASIASAMPWPPPMQSVTRPRFRPSR